MATANLHINGFLRNAQQCQDGTRRIFNRGGLKVKTSVHGWPRYKRLTSGLVEIENGTMHVYVRHFGGILAMDLWLPYHRYCCHGNAFHFLLNGL